MAAVLPSRRAALERCRAGLGAGPVLLTGEAGVGKSWLAQRLDDPVGGGWIGVDLSPAVGPADLWSLLASRLGIEAGPAPAVSIRGFLATQALDGRGWSLVLDELHTAGDALLEEIRILAGETGREGGFRALLLVGQTALVPRLRSPRWQGFCMRLAAHVHLLPLDAEEAAVFARGQGLKGAAAAGIDGAHRRTGGNPALLLQEWRAEAPAAGGSIAAGPSSSPGPAVAASPELDLERYPPLGAAEPPISLADNAIEVGWTDEPAVEASVADSLEPAALEASAWEPETDEPEPASAEPARGSFRIDDPYAALQAWTEWNRNQERPALAEPGGEPAARTPELAGVARVRPEAEHEGLPESHLFGRNRYASDSGA